MSRLHTLKSPLQSIPPRLKPVHQMQRERGRPAARRRLRVLQRDNYTCQECGLITTELEADHIVPLHLGGADSEGNLQALCRQCHADKTSREASERAKAGG